MIFYILAHMIQTSIMVNAFLTFEVMWGQRRSKEVIEKKNTKGLTKSMIFSQNLWSKVRGDYTLAITISNDVILTARGDLMLATSLVKKSTCRGNVWRPLLEPIKRHDYLLYKLLPEGGVAIRSPCKWTSLRQVLLTASLPLLLYHFIWNRNSKGMVSPHFRPKVLGKYHTFCKPFGVFFLWPLLTSFDLTWPQRSKKH